MSEFHVEVVRIGPIEKHPNADSLSFTKIHGGYPVILRTGEFNEGDLAVYVPIEAMVPATEARWDFLKGDGRIRAKRLRGIFSMGLLTAADPTWALGQDVAKELGITRFDPGEPEGIYDAKDPGFIPEYTDIEGFRRWPGVIQEGEEVVLTEKVHGESFRVAHHEGGLWFGSRTTLKNTNPASPWFRFLDSSGLAEKVAKHPGKVFYGEMHGHLKGFKYGANKQQGERVFRLFDVLDIQSRTYSDFDSMTDLAKSLDITQVPVLYRGPFNRKHLIELTEGASTLDPSHIREGVVVRPTLERYDALGPGRVILKLHGEAFLLKMS